MKKIYRAIEGHCVEKRFIADMADVPKGWFETPREAMDDWADRNPKPRAVPRRVEPAAPPPPPSEGGGIEAPVEAGEVGDDASEFETTGEATESENVGEGSQPQSPS